MAFFCKGRRERNVSPFDDLAKYESDKLAEHKKKFNRLYKPNGFKGFDAIIVPLSEGHERAIEIVRLLLDADIDPSVGRPIARSCFQWVELLDLAQIFGEDVIAFHDVLCKGDVAVTCAVLKALNLRWITWENLIHAIHNPENATFDPAEVLRRIKRVIPDFGINRS